MDSENDRVDEAGEDLGHDADTVEAHAEPIQEALTTLDSVGHESYENPFEELLSAEDPVSAEHPVSLEHLLVEEPLIASSDDEFEDVGAEPLETVRKEVIILFSDIVGSTSYFEREGDEEGLAMVQHHNDLLFPIIQGAGGRVVKTIGDAIMACFKDPVSAVRAAIGMQQALEQDRARTELKDHIHIRMALHMGPGIEKDNDVYGDVVNAAAKVQQQAQPDQILVTEVLLGAAKQAGAQCANLGRAAMKGKDEAIDVYAVSWSAAASQQLVEDLQKQYESQLKEARRQKSQLEEELENRSEQWRAERRRLTSEIEGLEAEVETARGRSGLRASEDLQAQVRYQLEETVRAKEQVEQELTASQARWEIERGRMQAQIESLQGAALESMVQTNNPARLALAVREQVDARLKEIKGDWQLQWDNERRRLNAEIERLKNAAAPKNIAPPVEDRKEAARQAVLQKLGKPAAPAAPSAQGWGSAAKTAQQWESELREARSKWETERDQVNLKVKQLERELQQSKDTVRQEVYQELRGQYEPRLESYDRERKRLKDDLEAANAQLAEERQRLNARIEHLEQSIPGAQEAARVQAVAELRADHESKMEEINRLRTRTERRAQDAAEESEAALRRANKEIARLQEELKEAKEAAFRHRKTRSSGA
jgi:class 3 adenylate cyclase